MSRANSNSHETVSAGFVRRRFGATAVARACAMAIVAFACSAAVTVEPVWASLPVPTSCQDDLGGANDEPGQKDLTGFCVDVGNGSPFDLLTSLNFDIITLSGGNTADGCTLYDTDGDDNANVAICVTLNGG